MQWFSCDEVLPRGLDMVLVNTDKGVGCAKYNEARGGFEQVTIPGSTQYGRYDISHWMPLPEAPESTT